MDEPSFDEARVAAYLRRIGAERPARPDAAALRALHRAHLLAVPFENLGIHLGEGVSLAPAALWDKVVGARRGGFCYELNGAFAALLTSLGYPVTLLAAGVHGRSGFGPPFDHLALRVDTPQPWLVDVGFGRHALFPLRLDERGEQHDPEGVFRITETPDGDLDVAWNGRPRYRVEQRPRALSDFTMACWWQWTSPDSHFTRSLVCSLPTADGRVTLSGRTLTATSADDRRTERELPEHALLAAYREHFGVTLERVPTLE